MLLRERMMTRFLPPPFRSTTFVPSLPLQRQKNNQSIGLLRHVSYPSIYGSDEKAQY